MTCHLEPGRGRRTAARVRIPAVAVAGVLLLAGCGSGQKSETYLEQASIDGANESIGDLAVRNVAVAAPRSGIMLEKGSDAPVTITVVNQGTTPDTLVSASAPNVASAVAVVGPSGTMQVPAQGTTGTRYSLVLRGLTTSLDTGSYVTLTLSFQRNGQKSLQVPVAVTNSDTTLPQNKDYKVPEADSNYKPLPG